MTMWVAYDPDGSVYDCETDNSIVNVKRIYKDGRPAGTMKVDTAEDFIQKRFVKDRSMTKENLCEWLKDTRII